MIVSYTIYHIICGIIFLSIFFLTALSKSFKNQYLPRIAVSVVFAAIVMSFTPIVFEISNNSEYEKRVLIFPSPKMSLGHKTYVINKSDKALLYQTITYSVVKPKYKEDNDDTEETYIICLPDSIISCPDGIDFILQEAPSYIHENIGGSMKKSQITYIEPPKSNEELLEDYNKELESSPFNVEYMYMKADILERLNRPEEAKELYQKAVNMYRAKIANTKSYYIGNCFQRLQMWQEAIDVYKEYLPNRQWKFSALQDMGFCYIAMDSLKLAKDSFKKASYMGENDPSFYFGLAIIAYKEDNKKEMIKNIDKIRELYPDFEQSYNNIVHGYYFSNENKEILEKVFLEYHNSQSAK